MKTTIHLAVVGLATTVAVASAISVIGCLAPEAHTQRHPVDVFRVLADQLSRVRAAVARLESDVMVVRTLLAPPLRKPVAGAADGGVLALDRSLASLEAITDSLSHAFNKWNLPHIFAGKSPVCRQVQDAYRLHRAFSAIEDPATTVELRAAAYRELCRQSVYIDSTYRAKWVSDVELSIVDDVALSSVLDSHTFLVVDRAVVSVLVATRGARFSATRHKLVSVLGTLADREKEALGSSVLRGLLMEMSRIDASDEVRRKAVKELERRGYL